MQAVVLGSGTSTGVPSVCCTCATCTSTDPRDKRLRTSLLLRSDATTVVIDTSSDFRQQMLTHAVHHIDGVVFTHHHFDHIGGFDDLRPYAFHTGNPVDVYGMPETLDVIQSTYPYAFGRVKPTGASVPQVALHELTNASFTIGDITLQPIPLLHGGMDVLGFRVADVAYCTDTNAIPQASRELLRGLRVLILDGLRWNEHPTHFSIPEALAVVEDLNPDITYLTHISHNVLHRDAESKLPPNVHLAFDGLVIEC